VNIAPRLLLSVLLLATPFVCAASEVSEIAIKAQGAWRAGDGDTLLSLAHPMLVVRIADLQTKWLTQEADGTGHRPWVKFPPTAPTLEKFTALPLIDKARAFFASMHEILSDHSKFTFTFDAENESIVGLRATVTVVEHQHSPDGKSRDVPYPFVLLRVKDQWKYLSGGSERLHVDTQLMLLGP
jgi:hypothetical protein